MQARFRPQSNPSHVISCRRPYSFYRSSIRDPSTCQVCASSLPFGCANHATQLPSIHHLPASIIPTGTPYSHAEPLYTHHPPPRPIYTPSCPIAPTLAPPMNPSNLNPHRP